MNLDKFYTSPEAADSFISFIEKHVDLNEFDNIIEPSAGAGALLNVLPSRTVGVDLAPERDDIIKSDFFDFQYPEGKTITVGNPPFGHRNQLAIAFFNRAAQHSDVIAFIIPVTWEKYSIHKQLAEGWALIASERLPEKSFILQGKPYQVRCSMQLWVKSDSAPSLRHHSQPTGENPYFDFVKKEDCEFAIRQAYPKTVNKEDIDGQSHYFIKPKVPGVKEVFESFEWQCPENKLMLGGASIPCLDKYTVVKFYEKYADLRKTEKEPTTHPDFSFVEYEDEWDVSILRLANPDAPPRRWLTGFSKEEGRSKVNRIYIKFHSDEAKELMTSIQIDKTMTDGMMPRVTPGILVKFYTQMKAWGYVDIGDLRKQKERAKVRKHHVYNA